MNAKPKRAAEDAIDADTAPPAEPGAVRTVQSLERAFAILEAVAASDEPVGLAELSRTTGLHTSTAFHLIRTLVHLGYVRQDDSKRYRVGPRLFMQAAGAFTENTLVDLAQPHLRRLADETGETAHLAVRADNGIAVIAKVEARSPIRSSERLGIIRPAHCTALGKVFLAELPAHEFDHWLAAAPLAAFTPKTITDRKALRAEIARVAVDGNAADDGEFNEELRCIAAPVRNFTGHTVAAIGVSGPVWRVTQKDLARLGTQVAATAGELSRELGDRGAPPEPRTTRSRRK